MPYAVYVMAGVDAQQTIGKSTEGCDGAVL